MDLDIIKNGLTILAGISAIGFLTYRFITRRSNQSKKPEDSSSDNSSSSESSLGNPLNQIDQGTQTDINLDQLVTLKDSKTLLEMNYVLIQDLVIFLKKKKIELNSSLYENVAFNLESCEILIEKLNVLLSSFG